jgi:hypothetical protein
MLCHFNVFLMLHSTDVTGQWFSPITRVSSPSKTDRYDIAEILLKVALNTVSVFMDTYSLSAAIQMNIVYVAKINF